MLNHINHHSQSPLASINQIGFNLLNHTRIFSMLQSDLFKESGQSALGGAVWSQDVAVGALEGVGGFV